VGAGFCWGLLAYGQLFSGWGPLTLVQVRPYRVAQLTQCVIRTFLGNYGSSWGCAEVGSFDTTAPVVCVRGYVPLLPCLQGMRAARPSPYQEPP
jgi:hypothetical protein